MNGEQKGLTFMYGFCVLTLFLALFRYITTTNTVKALLAGILILFLMITLTVIYIIEFESTGDTICQVKHESS